MSQTVKLRRSATNGSIPTTSQLALGELAINTYDGKLYLKKSVSGNETVVEIGANNLADVFKVYEYAVTSNTTVFSGSDENSNTLSYTIGSPPKVAVFLNGLLLDWGTDFTATNGSSVTLTSAAVSGDKVQIQAYKSEIYTGANLVFDDNVKALFGNDNDLQIFHNGSNSVIKDVGTGKLLLGSNTLAIRNVALDEDMLTATQNGAVNLFYDNSKKLETTATGIDVTGNVVATGDIIAADSNSSTNPSITFTGHTNTGLSVYQANSIDRLSIITGGAQRVNFGTHGVESFANVYTGNTSSFRNYGGTWSATTGVTGNGFNFINSVDGTALTLSSGGNAVFAGTISSGTITSSGDVRADTHFNSTDTNATLSATGSGNVYLRPNGKSSTSGQVHIATSGDATFAGAITINDAISGDASQFTILNGAGATLRMGITGSGANEAAHIKTNAGEALEFHIGQAANSTTPDIEFLADGAGINFQGVNILNSSKNMTTNSRFTFDYNDHYLEAGTNSIALKNSGGTSYFVASNTGLSVTGALSSTGDLTVGGNLTVNGSTTTLNTATLTVDDLNITVADGAANAAAANGAGLTVDGANATLTYTNSDDQWELNKSLRVASGNSLGGHTLLVENTGTAAAIIKFKPNSTRNAGPFIKSTPRGALAADGDIQIGDENGTIATFNAGRVGIGTTSPVSDLHVKTSVDNSVAQGLVIERSANTDRGYINYNGGGFQFRSTVGDPIVFGETDAEHMRIMPDGNVGIGDDSPAFKLAIRTPAIPSGSTFAWPLDLSRPNTDSRGLSFGVGASGGPHAIAAHNGDIHIGQTYGVDSNSLPQMYKTLNIMHDGTASEGKVGIGTETLTNKFHVSGDARIEGSLMAGGAAASNVPARPIHVKSAGDAAAIRIEDTTSSNKVYDIRSTHGEGLHFVDVTGGTTPMTIHTNGNVSVGAPSAQNGKLHVNGNFRVGPYYSADDRDGFLLIPHGTDTRLQSNNERFHIENGSGNILITPSGHVQIQEYAIETTETSTSATTQTVIHSMSATVFRSARFTIQVTNSTDSTYHTTEILMVHDGTNANITEFGKVFTANEEATFDADVSAGNVRLFATPATTDSMEFKVVCHSITV